jgi:hypothetical protein
MWIVRLALRRPYTFVVMAMLIVIGGIYSVLRMPTDILPEVDIPVISVVWQYGGLAPDEMEQRFTGFYERGLTTTVAGIEHIESQSLFGVSVTKVFFHPGTKMEMANAQVTAISQTFLKFLPVGATPPLIVNYSASNVPILQGSIHSDTLSEQQLYDLTSNFLRTGLATVQGAQMPVSLRRQAAPGDDRYRSPETLRHRTLTERREQRGASAKPRAAFGHREARGPRSPRAPEQQPGRDTRHCRAAAQDGERLHPNDRRRGAGARWLCPANEPGARKRPSRRPDDSP